MPKHAKITDNGNVHELTLQSVAASVTNPCSLFIVIATIDHAQGAPIHKCAYFIIIIYIYDINFFDSFLDFI